MRASSIVIALSSLSGLAACSAEQAGTDATTSALTVSNDSQVPRPPVPEGIVPDGVVPDGIIGNSILSGNDYAAFHCRVGAFGYQWYLAGHASAEVAKSGKYSCKQEGLFTCAEVQDKNGAVLACNAGVSGEIAFSGSPR